MEAKSEVPQPIVGPVAPRQTFEKQLSADLEWGLSEASLFLDGKGAVHDTLRRICKRLDEARIPYVVVGGMALYVQGFQRFTKDVDLLVTAEGLRRIHDELEGLGYVRAFPGSKNLRDAQTRVAIEFLVAGQYPGDGRPKPVAFPMPEDVGEAHGGIRYLNLASLIELKLASGISNQNRLKDLGDVQELLKVLVIPKDFSLKLNPYVRPKFEELWDAVHAPRRFIRRWRHSAETAAQLAAMQADGVTIESGEGPTDKHALLVTTDPDVARKYDMHEESEFWDESDETRKESGSTEK